MRAPVPPFTAEHERLRSEMRTFVETRLRPHADEWEQAAWFPDEVFGWLAEAGYLGLKFPAEYGGGGDPVAAAVLVEELARCGSGGVAAGSAPTPGSRCPRSGPSAPRSRSSATWSPGSAESGSPRWPSPSPGRAPTWPRSARTPSRVDGGYLVNGAKTFITGGVRADFLVTAVKTTPEGGHHGISFVIVERGPGVSSSALRKLGWHASDTAEIAFDDVFVPEENLLGRATAAST